MLFHNKQPYGGTRDVLRSIFAEGFRNEDAVRWMGVISPSAPIPPPPSQSFSPTAHESDGKYYWRTDRPGAVTHRVKSLISSMMGPLHPKVRM